MAPQLESLKAERFQCADCGIAQVRIPGATVSKCVACSRKSEIGGDIQNILDNVAKRHFGFSLSPIPLDSPTLDAHSVRLAMLDAFFAGAGRAVDRFSKVMGAK